MLLGEESTESNYIQQSELVSDADINAIPSSPPIFLDDEGDEPVILETETPLRYRSYDAQEDSGLHRSLTPPRRYRYRYVILDERDKIAPSPTLRRASQPSLYATQNLSKDENYREDSDEDSDEDYREDSDEDSNEDYREDSDD
ncbi:hypothetical protein V496_02410 [Pseudogymnoascus sp. VKM F-4515 (FW-2607)]|nr:hypothetical protein V496_02410 [Pseudogymnoascus sp. VKM F-4515 (FW-2607)]